MSSGLFVVEGIHHVGEAIASAVQGNVRVVSIYYAPDLLHSSFGYDLIEEYAAEDGVCYATTPEVFESIAEKENPQGILAIVEMPKYQLSNLAPDRFLWGVALVDPQDPGNVGTILRTIDAVGASGLILLDSNLDIFHPSLVRASMGTVFWYPVVQTSFAEFMVWSNQHGYHLYGTSAAATVHYRMGGVYRQPMILLMGSEREGLNPEQMAVCEELVQMPMYGRSTSLNLAVATGVMLYEILERSPSRN